jgi:hypothetical protein
MILHLLMVNKYFDTPELLESGQDLSYFGLQDNQTLQFLLSPSTIIWISIGLKVLYLVSYSYQTKVEAFVRNENLGTYIPQKATGFLNWYPNQNEEWITSSSFGLTWRRCWCLKWRLKWSVGRYYFSEATALQFVYSVQKMKDNRRLIIDDSFNFVSKRTIDLIIAKFETVISPESEFEW